MLTRLDQLSGSLDEAFANTPQAPAMQWVMRPLLRLLSRGRPVTIEQLADAAGRDVEAIRGIVPMLPSVELDLKGRVVGSGITLNPTPHRFIVDGQVLYTWCALDTLIFPPLLGKSARVESPCHGTGEVVRLTVIPQRGTSVEPAESVVSIVAPSDMSTVRSSFCDHVHFFSSDQAATGWLTEHPDATVVPVADAFELGRRLAATRFTDSEGGSCC
jgi:alkylmercury lyase